MLLTSFFANSQGFNYQAIVSDSNGAIVASQNVTIRLSIVYSSANGTVAYTETHGPTTDARGLINIVVGAGTQTSSGAFTSVDWSTSSLYLKTELDLGSGYVNLGTDLIGQVPIALFAKKLDGIDKLQKWDSAFYSEKLKKEIFNLDQEILKPYFQLENVIQGVFTVSKRLFNLTFEEVFTIEKYHEDVKTYHVKNTKGEFIAILYADFHPREGKRNGAWMTSYKSQQIKNNSNERPHISIVCNFTKPTETKPSLLTFNEVTTLFHEFGHALHGMLANTTYSSLSGTSVSWDFVELPSQILENWCYEEEALALFAKHYQTGEVIPMEYVKKIKESASFHEGMQTLRQLSFGLLDMAWHGGKTPKKILSVKEFEAEAFSETQLYPDVSENCMSTAFSHIFQGGYSAGYYSYKWAEILDADAFEYFQEKGIFDKEVAAKFEEHVLSKGGTEKPMILYKRFRGKEPRPEALLKRAGLL